MEKDPHGFVEFRAAVAEAVPSFAMETFFDVGANVGQTVAAVRNAFEKVSIWAFEPVPQSFEQLQTRFGSTPDVILNNYAMGAKSGVAVITTIGTSTGNRLVASSHSKSPTVEVQVRTGDEVLASSDVDRVSYLKVDTEGGDLDVLVGFQHALADKKIDMVEVEASLNPSNTKHVSIERFKGYLEPMGYYLFQMKSFASDRSFSGHPYLRRCNLIFVSPSIAAANRQRRKKI